LSVYSQKCNLAADQSALVTKAAPFLAFLDQRLCTRDKIRGFADGIAYFFDTSPVPEAALKSSRGFKRWLGITALHVKSCSGTCTQKGGCDCA